MDKSYAINDFLESLGVEAQKLVRDGRVDEAIQVISKIPWPTCCEGWSFERTLALIAVSKKLIELGQEERARTTLDEAIRCCDALQHGTTWEAADCYAEIALILARLNLLSEAVAMWEKGASSAQINQHFDYDCIKVLKKISRYLADIGEIKIATEVASLIELEEVRVTALAYVQSKNR